MGEGLIDWLTDWWFISHFSFSCLPLWIYSFTLFLSIFRSTCLAFVWLAGWRFCRQRKTVWAANQTASTVRPLEAGLRHWMIMGTLSMCLTILMRRYKDKLGVLLHGWLFCLTKLTNGETTNFLINNWLVYCFNYMAIGHTSSFIWLTYCVTCPNHWFGVFRDDHSGWRVDKSSNFFYGLTALLYLVHSTSCELVVSWVFFFYLLNVFYCHTGLACCFLIPCHVCYVLLLHLCI